MPKKPRLSRSEKGCMFLIEHFYKENGYPPTYQELADIMGFSTRSHTYAIVKRLEAKGKVRVIRGQSRGILLEKSS